MADTTTHPNYCQPCDQRFESPGDLGRHLVAAHTGRPCTCEAWREATRRDLGHWMSGEVPDLSELSDPGCPIHRS